MTRVVRILLMAAIVIGVVLSLRAAAAQRAPNVTRAVIGSREVFCSPDGRFARTGQTGWLPTDRCSYPVAVPLVRR